MKKDILNETFNKHTFLLKKRLYEQGVIQQQPVQEENLDEDLKSIVTAGLLGLFSLLDPKDKPTNNVTPTGTKTTAVATNTVGVTPISKDDLKKFDNLTYRSGLAIANYWLQVIKMSKEEGLPIPSLVNIKEDGARAAGEAAEQIKYLQDWAKGKAGIMKAGDYSSKVKPPEEISLAKLLQKSIVNGEGQGGQFSSMYEDSQLGSETDKITEEIITKIIKIKYPNFKPTDRNEDTDNVTTAVRNLKNLNIFYQYVDSAERIISAN